MLDQILYSFIYFLTLRYKIMIHTIIILLFCAIRQETDMLKYGRSAGAFLAAGIKAADHAPICMIFPQARIYAQKAPRSARTGARRKNEEC